MNLTFAERVPSHPHQYSRVDCTNVCARALSAYNWRHGRAHISCQETSLIQTHFDSHTLQTIGLVWEDRLFGELLFGGWFVWETRIGNTDKVRSNLYVMK